VWLLALDGGGNWADLGQITSDSNYISVQPLENRTMYKNITNPNGYFQLVNGLFQDKDWTRQKALQVAGNSTESPDAYQICRLFDFIKSNLTYITDPEQNENEWITPKETILRGGGDCEDQAITLAALAISLGATTRCHFTSTHAFASVFCGDLSGLSNVTASISTYYGMTAHPPDIVSYHDAFGYWVMMDPIAGFYPGAPPLGCSPVKAENDGYSWDFISTKHVISIDILG
jgi:transglutaminase-like putative cysteine protease